MTFEQKVQAATAWRRSGMSFREIGRRLNVDKDRLREALKARGLSNGWGADSSILHSSSSSGGGFSAMSSGDDS